MGTLSTVLIEELTGAMRSVELQGGGLPHAGAEWAARLKVTTTWYPGNGDEATQQVLGPQEMPSKWEGTWRTTQLTRAPVVVTDGGTFRVVDPTILWDVFDALRAGGARLRVTWQSQTPDLKAVTVVREGRLTEFTVKVDRATDIKWEANWDWLGRGSKAQKVAATRDASVADTKDALQAELTDFTTSLDSSPVVTSGPRQILKAPSAFTLGQLESFAQAPLAIVNSAVRAVQQQVSRVQQLGDLASGIANEPFAIADACVTLARNTVATANVMGDTLSAQPVEAQSLKSDAVSLTRAAVTFGKTLETQRRLSRAAQRIADTTRLRLSRNQGGPSAPTHASSALANGGLLAVHVTRNGDTAEGLSRRYYKTSDGAVDILRANHLPWTQVSFAPGTTLIIPLLTSKKGF